MVASNMITDVFFSWFNKDGNVAEVKVVHIVEADKVGELNEVDQVDQVNKVVESW